MRKVLAVLALVALLVPVFADDALVLPAGVLRTYVTGAYAFGDQEFDADGKKVDTNALKAVNLGLALEYGVNDWISAGLQWAPGYNVWSDIDLGAPVDTNVNDFADLFVGAKIQIIGPNAPVKNETMRLAVTPGVKIPMPGVDWAKQADNYLNGDPTTVAEIDAHTLAFGGRVSFDYVIADGFYFNLFSEYIKYLERKDVNSLFGYLLFGDAAAADVAIGYSLKLEAEPHYEFPMANNAKLSFGLPVTYEMAPESEVDGVAQDDASNSISISPSASYFFLAGKLPFEVKLGYTLPLMGVNTGANNTIVFQLKSYLKF